MQLSYSANMTPAIAGNLYDISPHTVDSALAEAVVTLGALVVPGTDPLNQCKIPTATFSVYKGIALNQAKEQNSDGTVTFAIKDTVPVLRHGRAWVTFASGYAVTAETQAYFIFSGTGAGTWTTLAGYTAVTSSNAVIVNGAKFITTNTSTTGGVVAVELA